MPLTSVPLSPTSTPLPRDVRLFLREATRRIERFQSGRTIPSFVPSDFASAYQTLAAFAESAAVRGRLFCEWGSGFGVIACLAAMLDFDAYGIEIEEELVVAAQELADDFGLPVEFIRDSFIPPGSEDCFKDDEQYAWLTLEGNGSTEAGGVEPDDFDVIFAYPWPDEERLTAALFERHARAGAVLITYHGGEYFNVHRKIRRKSRREWARPG